MCYLYLRLPQGFLASNDTDTYCYDNVIKNKPRKVEITDDTCLFDHNIEEAFFHTWDDLSLCARNGNVINETSLNSVKI